MLKYILIAQALFDLLMLIQYCKMKKSQKLFDKVNKLNQITFDITNEIMKEIEEEIKKEEENKNDK